jgi:hypothetical protein
VAASRLGCEPESLRGLDLLPYQTIGRPAQTLVDDSGALFLRAGQPLRVTFAVNHLLLGSEVQPLRNKKL